MTHYPPNRRMKLGTPTGRRCARCGRRIKHGKHHVGPDGATYGEECIQKVLDKANSGGVSS